MNPDLAYDKKLYYQDKKQYLTSLITHEDNYLIWKYICYLRREEAAKNKLIAYYYRRKKNNLGAKLGIQVYAGTCGRGLHIWHYGSTIISGEARMLSSRWFAQPGRRYMDLATCPEHGKFLIRVRLSDQPDGLPRVSRLTYEATSEAAEAYRQRVEKAEPERRDRRRRTRRRRTAAEPTAEANE